MPSKRVEADQTHFKTTRFKCKLPLLETKFVRLSQNGVEIELFKKFEGIELKDLFELAMKATSYEAILKEENDRKEATKRIYYKDLNYTVANSDISFCPWVVLAKLFNENLTLARDSLRWNHQSC